MTDTLLPPTRARGDVPAERVCLKCKSAFWSEGFGARLCKRCKAGGTWKNGALARGPVKRGGTAGSQG